jgi:hypothetical protein
MVVPLKLNLVAFEEVLLRGWHVEVGYVVYSHCRGLALIHVSWNPLSERYHHGPFVLE